MTNQIEQLKIMLKVVYEIIVKDDQIQNLQNNSIKLKKVTKKCRKSNRKLCKRRNNINTERKRRNNKFEYEK